MFSYDTYAQYKGAYPAAFSQEAPEPEDVGSACQRLNEFCFSPCEDGVLITGAHSIKAWVHDRWQRIDVALREPMQNAASLYNVLLRAYQYVAVHAGALVMHAAAVQADGSGILFCGVPGAGKSTQARLWEQAFGAETINNDQPCIIFEEDRAFVCGSPWSGKEPCYRDVCVPARAIVFVEKSAENRIEKLSPAEAYSLLFLNEFVIPIRPETEKAYEEAIRRLIGCVPVYRQYCTISVEAPALLKRRLDQPDA